MTKTRGARAHGALAAGLGSALVLAAALKGAASLGDARAPAPVAPTACAGGALCVAPAACAELSPAALRGRRIFHHGALASGEPVEGRLAEGGAALRGKAAACAGCHGRSGDGTAEGGVAAPPLTPEQLFSADRPDGPYTAETLATAVREGRTPAARELHLVMPRYRLDGAQLADLVAYLRCVGRDADPGVSPDALRLGAASAAAARLRPRAVLLAGEGDELSRWLAAQPPSAGPRGPRPAVYALASLMPHDPGSLRLAGAVRLLLLHPGPFDEAERLGLLSLSSFLERNHIPSRHTAFQASAYAAASVLVEALKRAGAHLTRPGLVAALEGLRAFDPGPGPAITFGRNRRVGAYGARLSRVDPSSADVAHVAHVAPVSAWVEVVP
ncbi:ABC transporter substrate-binding protein [Sorangium sp. So ce136]|uniref:c-type cytochrome n=1 Tax=Sorangium sp. So ce136 TaxID=3133284 RepID=UPI003F105BAF